MNRTVDVFRRVRRLLGVLQPLRWPRMPAAMLGLIAAPVVLQTGTGGQNPPPPPPPPLKGMAVLRVWPDTGHSGDRFYISGTGLRPNIRVNFLMACPDWYHVDFRYQNYQLMAGTRTGANGDILDFPLHALHLKGVPTSSCTIYAMALHGGTFATDQNALYRILAPDTPLPYAATHIVGNIRLSGKVVKAGSAEHVTITSRCNGAYVDLLVTYANMQEKTIRVRLDAKGTYRGTLPIGGDSGQVGPVHVRASFHLGKVKGTTSTSFLVVR